MSRLIRFGPYLVDQEQRALFRGDQLVALSPKVLETLEVLAIAQGRIVSKTEFMQVLWPSTFVEEGNLTQNIFVLRRALGVTDTGHAYIETIPKRGYRFAVPVAIEERPKTETPEVAVTAPVVVAETASVSAPPKAEGAPGEPGPHEAALSSAGEGRSRRLWWPWGLLAGCLLLVALFLLLGLRAPGTKLQETGARRLTNDGVPKNLGAFPAAMVNDGKRLRFTERRNNRSYLADVPLDGGEVHVQTAPFPGAVMVDYSQRNASLLIGSVWRNAESQPLLTEDAAGNIRPLGALRGHDASFSPDGTEIAFARGNSLEIAKADGSGAQPIVAGKGLIYWPRWSPDGRSLRFSENYGSNETRLWEVNVDGGALHQVLAHDPNRDHVCCGTWSADGRWYYYLVLTPSSSSIWAVPGQSAWWRRLPKAEQVVPSHDMAWQAPVVSANGSRLWTIGSDARAELLRVNPATRALEPYLGGLSAEGVSFSPDGKLLAYTAFPEGTLWLSRVDGSGRRQLTQRPVVARFPRWSPDGRTIAFLAGQPGSNWRLFLADVPSGATRALLEDRTSQGVASWSPDGRKVLFGRLPNYGNQQDPPLCLEIYDLQHGTLQTLEGSQDLWTPRWSPDGRYIVAVTGDNQRLRLYDTERHVWSDLANMGANDIVWTPDSRSIFFDTVLGTAPLLYRVRIADRKMERWADLQGLNRGGLFSPWLGVSADGQPILLRDRTIEEIYEFTIQEVP